MTHQGLLVHQLSVYLSLHSQLPMAFTFQLQASGIAKGAMHVHVIVYDTVYLMKPVTGKT